MKNITLNLFEKETEHGFMPTLTTYLLDRYKMDEEELRPAVLVLPFTCSFLGGVLSRHSLV